MLELKARHKKILKGIPEKINDVDILLFLQKQEVNWEYIQTLKESTQIKDELLSYWLNMNVKTFRSYKKKQDQEINASTKEHVLLLLSLMQHGKSVFGTAAKFQEWLEKDNFFFNSHPPKEYLKTITGIRFVDDRLIAMEYGDNV